MRLSPVPRSLAHRAVNAPPHRNAEDSFTSASFVSHHAGAGAAANALPAPPPRFRRLMRDEENDSPTYNLIVMGEGSATFFHKGGAMRFPTFLPCWFSSHAATQSYRSLSTIATPPEHCDSGTLRQAVQEGRFHESHKSSGGDTKTLVYFPNMIQVGASS